MIDLHMHTTFSDGSISPTQLVDTVVANGVKVFAITDHDNTNSHAEALEAVAKYPDVTLIPGIEINTHYDQYEVHVLGYFIDIHNDYLKEVCHEHNCQRHQQISEFVDKVAKASKAKLCVEDVFAQSREGGTIGRPHIAKALVQKGGAGNMSEAFRKFLVPTAESYVRRKTVTPHEAVEAISDAGGLAVIAHPGDMPIIEDLTKDLMNYGLAGLEAYHKSHSPGIIAFHCHLAEKLGLIVTGGTDFHGVIEHYPNALKQTHVPAWVYDKLLEERERRQKFSIKAG